ncbi:TadE/TadG family type IV pilus assembly protein [Herbidospora mongoliensis]|uniref:TadE/TadG family type IV pilus assembly protein n=1 Tax=Herbidospora mongoliensis TaxID=688067 RepID=UPI00082DD170|nr:TadE/TadG family type IV pilus assembly protein [Herbidospora mongoliensis]
MGDRVGDRGSMSVETVMLAPVLVLFLLFLVGAGRVVEAQGEVNGAARDAARAASVQRDEGAAQEAATSAATDALADCPPEVSMAGTQWQEGGVVEVTVSCSLDLDFLGFGTNVTITGDSVVPLEQFRRVE